MSRGLGAAQRRLLELLGEPDEDGCWRPKWWLAEQARMQGSAVSRAMKRLIDDGLVVARYELVERCNGIHRARYYMLKANEETQQELEAAKQRREQAYSEAAKLLWGDNKDASDLRLGMILGLSEPDKVKAKKLGIDLEALRSM